MDTISNKPKEDLLQELQAARNAYDSLQLLYQNETREKQKMESKLSSQQVLSEFMFQEHETVMLLIEPVTGKIIDANKTAVQFYNYPIDQLRGMPIEAINVSNREQIEIDKAKALKQEQNLFIFPHRISSGEIRQVEVHSSPVEWNGQRLLFSIIHDITEREAFDSKLKKSEDALRKAEEIGKFGNWSLLLNEKLVRASDGAILIYEFSQNEIPLDQVKEVALPEYRLMLNKALDDLINEGKPYDIEYKIKRNSDGRIIDIHSVAEFDASKNIVFGTIQDISERKRTEKALIDSEEKYHSLFANMIEGAALHQIVYNEQDVAIDYVILETNPAYEAHLNISHPSVIGKTSREAYGIDDPPFLEMYSKVALTGEPAVFETYFQPLGKHFSISVFSPYKGSFATIFVDITAHKSIEDNLLESKLLLYEAQRLAQIGIWNWDKETNTSTWSEELSKIVGRDPNLPVPAFKEQHFVFTPESYEQFTAAIEKVKETGQKIELELEVVHSDGSLRNVVGFVGMKYDSKGKVKGLYGTLQDITDRKKAVEELRNSKEQYDSIVSKIPVGIYILRLHPDGSVVFDYVSPRLAEMFNSTVENLQSDVQLAFQRVHPDEYEAFISLNMESGRKMCPFEWQGRIETNGSYNWVQITSSPEPQHNGDIIWNGLVVDITERVKAEIALRETNSYLENLLNYANAPIIVWDPHFRITRFNHAFETLTGRLEADVLGESLNILFPPELSENSMKLIRKTLSGERWETVEIKIININKTVRTVLWNSATLVGPDGKTPVATIAQGQDITERKQIEEEMKNTNAALVKIVAEKNKFFSIIAHDLRSPFNGFLGLTQIMAEKLPELTMDEIQKIAVSMRTSATNLFRLLENLLQWARIEQGAIPFNPKYVSLQPLVAESISMSLEPALKKSIELDFSVSKDIEVFADTNMLQTIIRNIVSNAVKYTNAGGKIMLAAKAVADKNIEIAVLDTGIGMSSEMLDNLFRINVQTNRKGTAGEPSTGLGLVICKEFIEKHGGKLKVESEVGKGSTFRFTIPFNTQPHEKTSAKVVTSADKTTKSNEGLKILIAEDDETSGMLISIALKSFSKVILKATTGYEAVEVCKKNPDIDLIMMDIKMPDMDGYEATRLIREFNTKVVIIAQTAFGKTGDREMSIEAGFNDYISKPLSIALLKELVAKNFNM